MTTQQKINARSNAAKRKLSKRQLEIALMLCNGNSLKQIASDLHLDLRTVDYHTNMLRYKMQAQSTIVALLMLVS